jgi:2-succinyl-6-hydroxy-2,4-cyclohexadiene-1-carboxylate synthase
MTDHQLEINGVSYHVRVQGRGNPLLMLHGFTGSSQNWESIMPALSERYQVVSVDLLGHGRTDAPTDPVRYAMPQAAADLIAIADYLNLDRFHLLGYSMGGRLALYTAIHYAKRVQALILESSSPGLATEVERSARIDNDNALADRIERAGIETFVNFWESIGLWESQRSLSSEVRQRVRHLRLQNNAVGLANSLRGMGTGQQPSLWDHLQSITIPVLLLTGELDTKFEALNDQMNAHIRSSVRTTIATAGHTVHLEKPTQYTKTVQSFLDDHR